MKRILAKNSIFGLGQAVINLIFVFLVIPVFIKMLGSVTYGVFALVMVVGNLNSFTNLGLTNALVKFIAEQGRSEKSNIDIFVNLILLIAAILPLTLVFIYFNEFILLDLLKIPLKVFDEAKGLFILVLWANFLLLIGQVFKAILDALQKVYVTSLVQIFYNFLYWGLILTALLLGFNLPAIGLAIFIAALIWLVITIINAKKVWGKYSAAGFYNNYKNATKKQLSYGLKIYASGLIGFFYEPLSKILISNFIGVSEVGFYDIALKLRSQIWGFIAQIFYPLFPFISKEQDKSVIRKYVHDLEQKSFLIIVPIIVLVILLMHPFISIWIGKDVDIISITAIFIISFHLIGSSVIPNYQFLMAKNLAQKTIILQLSNVIFNGVFFLITIQFLGYYALIVGNVAAIVSSFILSLYYQHKYLDSLIFDSSKQIIKLLIVGCIMFGIGFMTNTFITSNLLRMVLDPMIVIIAAIFLYRSFNMISLEDIKRYSGDSLNLSRLGIKLFVK